ncbi:extracellular solute-binding protein [Pseudomonas akapageensis]|uniref:extracellular solute-binding protein n=1 Tax=Pseudomonas akapageensis TaxID=2609961 RepID=UPI00140AE06B|nr:extracellular solute-binding protein [Pseudomonas akapageensis]
MMLKALRYGIAGFTLSCLTSLCAQAQEPKELFFYNWTDYYPVELLAKFEKETGIKVTMDGYDSNETLLAKLQAGGAAYDVIVPSQSIMRTLIEQNLLLEIDAPTLANFKNVKAAFRDPSFDPGRKFSAPYLWGSTGFSYDSARVPGGKLDDSWKEFFEPRPEVSGQLAALDTSSSVINAASHYLGVDECSENPQDAKRILELLQKQKPHLKMYSSDNTVDRMASGEVIMMQNWNGSTARATLQKSTIKYVYPREGLAMFQDNFAVPKSAPHPDNAKVFIDWMMKPENAAAVSNAIAYANGIESDKLLDPKWKVMDAINMPEEFASRLRPEKECSNKARELQDRIWSKLKG